MELLDFVVVGCVAVTRAGGRTGKGGGFADLELGIFRELGKVGAGDADRHHGPFEPGRRRRAPADDAARFGAALHRDREGADRDRDAAIGQPAGVDWDRVQPDQYENIPFLKELRARSSAR